eukprot:1182604-Prorocentrum_minimum.AAC.1
MGYLRPWYAALSCLPHPTILAQRSPTVCWACRIFSISNPAFAPTPHFRQHRTSGTCHDMPREARNCTGDMELPMCDRKLGIRPEDTEAADDGWQVADGLSSKASERRSLSGSFSKKYRRLLTGKSSAGFTEEESIMYGPYAVKYGEPPSARKGSYPRTDRNVRLGVP